MADVRLDFDASQLDKLKLLTEKQIRYATGRAMAAAVRTVHKDLRADLASTSGPIQGGAARWTIGGAQFKLPTPTNLVAEVGLPADKPRAAGRYVSTLIKGTKPRTKGADLAASALVGRRVTMVPTRSQKVDAKGNVSRTVYRRTLTGWASMRKTRTMVNKANRMFIIPIKGAEGRMGIFQRLGRRGVGTFGKLDGAVMRFTLEPEPKQRRATYDIKRDMSTTLGQQWPKEIQASLAAELRRAGFR